VFDDGFGQDVHGLLYFTLCDQLGSLAAKFSRLVESIFRNICFQIAHGLGGISLGRDDVGIDRLFDLLLHFLRFFLLRFLLFWFFFETFLFHFLFRDFST